MEKTVRKFQSYSEAEEADQQYYRSLTPQERLDLLLELVHEATSHEAQQGFARVYRITQLHGGQDLADLKKIEGE